MASTTVLCGDYVTALIKIDAMKGGTDVDKMLKFSIPKGFVNSTVRSKKEKKTHVAITQLPYAESFELVFQQIDTPTLPPPTIASSSAVQNRAGRSAVLMANPINSAFVKATAAHLGINPARIVLKSAGFDQNMTVAAGVTSNRIFKFDVIFSDAAEYFVKSALASAIAGLGTDDTPVLQIDGFGTWVMANSILLTTTSITATTTTTTTTTTGLPPAEDNSGLVIGAVLGAILFLLVCFLLAYYFQCCRDPYAEQKRMITAHINDAYVEPLDVLNGHFYPGAHGADSSFMFGSDGVFVNTLDRTKNFGGLDGITLKKDPYAAGEYLSGDDLVGKSPPAFKKVDKAAVMGVQIQDQLDLDDFSDNLFGRMEDAKVTEDMVDMDFAEFDEQFSAIIKAPSDPLTKAVTRIQANWRGKQVRKKIAAEMKAEMQLGEVDEDFLAFMGDVGDDEATTKAATTIQAGFRGHKARKDLSFFDDNLSEDGSVDDEEAAALKAREDAMFAEFKGEMANPDVATVDATTKIQAAFRGHQARKGLANADNAERDAEQKIIVEREQALFDEFKEEMADADEATVDATTKIQAAFRGHQARKLLKPAGPVIRNPLTYTIAVTTGTVAKAGTDSNIGIELTGKKGTTYPGLALQRSTTYKDKFEKGHTDQFAFANIPDLGDLTQMRLISDSARGKHIMNPKWFVESVEVTSSAGGKYFFSCKAWLSKKDGLVKAFKMTGCTPQATTDDAIAEHNATVEATTKIQAAFRGHQVRKSLATETEDDKDGAEMPIKRKSTFKGKVAGVITGIRLNDAIQLNNFGNDFMGSMISKKPDLDMVRDMESQGALEEDDDFDMIAAALNAQVQRQSSVAAAERPDLDAIDEEELEQFKEEMANPDEATVQATTKIQASFRGHKARKDLALQHEKQAIQEREEAIMEDFVNNADDETIQATTKIQASFRGHKARKDLALQHEKQAIQEREEAMMDDMVNNADDEMVQATTKIQASFRGHKARKELAEGGPSAVKTSDAVERLANSQKNSAADVPGRKRTPNMATFEAINNPKNPNQLAAKHFDREHYHTLQPPDQADMLKCVKSGAVHPDAAIGCYALTASDYDRFGKLFQGIAQEYHKMPSSDWKHPISWDWSKVKKDAVGEPMRTFRTDSVGMSKVSLRLRASRNFAEYPLAGSMTTGQRLQMESKVCAALKELDNHPDFGGRYYSLTPGHPDQISTEEYAKMAKQQVMYKPLTDKRLLNEAGISSDWPSGRGAYVSKNKRYMVWVGEEDHVRATVQMVATTFSLPFERLSSLLTAVCGAKDLTPVVSGKYGYITSCPTRIGTTLFATLTLPVPGGTAAQITRVCAQYGMSSKEKEKGRYEINLLRRLGLSEVQSAVDMWGCVKALRKMGVGGDASSKNIGREGVRMSIRPQLGNGTQPATLPAPQAAAGQKNRRVSDMGGAAPTARKLVRALPRANAAPAKRRESKRRSTRRATIEGAKGGLTYTVSVTTGNVPKAGTDATITLQMAGPGGTSEPLVLDRSSTHKDKFEKGNVDVFAFPGMVDLGNVSQIQLSSDNKRGKHVMNPQWFVDSVEITTSNGGRWSFECQTWLSQKNGLSQTFNPTVDFFAVADTAAPTKQLSEVDTFRQMAEQGSAHAQYVLGEMYQKGQNGIVHDPEEAFKWYRRASIQGDRNSAVKANALLALNPELGQVEEGNAETPSAADSRRRPKKNETNGNQEESGLLYAKLDHVHGGRPQLVTDADDGVHYAAIGANGGEVGLKL